MTQNIDIEQQRREFEAWYNDPDRSGSTFGYQGTPAGIHAAFKEQSYVAWLAAKRAAMPAKTLDVDALAQEIRRVDGNHSLGAGALAEALMPFIERAAVGSAEPVGEVFNSDLSNIASLYKFLPIGTKLFTAPPVPVSADDLAAIKDLLGTLEKHQGTIERCARHAKAVRALLNQPAPVSAELVETNVVATFAQVQRFMDSSLKPEEISGTRRAERIRELLCWFDRFIDGHANPKWLKSHAMELCYFIGTERLHSVLGPAASAPLFEPTATPCVPPVKEPKPPKWYTRDEIVNILGLMNYSDLIAQELADWMVLQLTYAFNKGFQVRGWDEYKSALLSADAKDSERLDFMADEHCAIEGLQHRSITKYRLYWHWFKEPQSEWYETPREAIDAARAAIEAKEKK